MIKKYDLTLWKLYHQQGRKKTKLEIPVQVLDQKSSFGRKIYKVSIVGGKGELWISKIK